MGGGGRSAARRHGLPHVERWRHQAFAGPFEARRRAAHCACECQWRRARRSEGRRNREFRRRGAPAAGTGKIVAAEWDFIGMSAWQKFEVAGDSETVTVKATHVYDKSGTYFASFRVGS